VAGESRSLRHDGGGVNPVIVVMGTCSDTFPGETAALRAVGAIEVEGVIRTLAEARWAVHLDGCDHAPLTPGTDENGVPHRRPAGSLLFLRRGGPGLSRL
jgi:hypothetical protein